jgi:Cytochrome P450
MVPEIIRWQTPILHMAPTALGDIRVGDAEIKAGDRIAMWYLSGNRDDTEIEDPEAFIIDRPQPRRHLSFGFGVHHCVVLSTGRAAIESGLGGNLKTFSPDRGGRRTSPCVLQHHSRLYAAAGDCTPLVNFSKTTTGMQAAALRSKFELGTQQQARRGAARHPAHNRIPQVCLRGIATVEFVV